MCSISHCGGDGGIDVPRASHTQLAVAPHTSNLTVSASTHTWRCCARGTSPLTQSAAGSVGGWRWTRATLPACTIRRALGRRESDRKHVGRIMFVCLGAKQRLMREQHLQGRTTGVCASQRENNCPTALAAVILWH